MFVYKKYKLVIDVYLLFIWKKDEFKNRYMYEIKVLLKIMIKF